MTPTLSGRIQTRLALTLTVGVVVTLMVTPFLPYNTYFSRTRHQALPGAYLITFASLGLVAAVGVVWELIYHGLQQLRWDKDWPSPLGILTGLNESIVVYVMIRWFGPRPHWTGMPPSAFLLHFYAVWLAVFFTANGPMRVLLIRWRYRGGRIV